MTTGYGFDGRGLIPGKRNFSLLHSSQTYSGAHPASYPMGAVGALFPGGAGGVKRPGRETSQLYPYTAEVKNDGVIPALSHTFHGEGLN
jgi:hypothetical protein